MATSKKEESKEKTSTSLVAIGSQKVALTLLGEKMKAEIDAEVKAIKEFTLTDAESVKAFLQKLTGANKFVKLVDDKRKAAKEPYLESGRTIDQAAKFLTEEVEKAIKDGKKRVLEKEEELERLAKEEQEKAAQQAELDTEKIQQGAAFSGTVVEFILHYKKEAIGALAECFTMDALKEAYEKYVKPGFPDADRFGDLQDEAFELKKSLIEFKDQQKERIKRYTEAKNANNKREMAAVKHEAEMAVIEMEEAAEQQNEEMKEAVQESVVEQTQMVQAKAVSVASSMSAPAVLTRKSWKFELENIQEVPYEWLMLDEAKVKEFIKNNKDKNDEDEKAILTDGCIINGIKFTTEESIVLR